MYNTRMLINFVSQSPNQTTIITHLVKILSNNIHLLKFCYNFQVISVGNMLKGF